MINWINTMWYIYTMEYYAAIKKNEIVARHRGSHLQSQHFGRLRQADHLSSGFETSLTNIEKPRLY